jgi:dCMP deaminase
MKTAIEFASISNCRRLKVGAVITKNNRITSTGYNGTPSGTMNCADANSRLNLEDPEESLKHNRFSSQFEIHAEMNAIIDMAKRGISPEGCTIYTNIMPCKDCAKLIVAAGITRLVYLNEYDRESCRVTYKPEEGMAGNLAIIYEELNGKQILKILNPEIVIEQLLI